MNTCPGLALTDVAIAIAVSAILLSVIAYGTGAIDAGRSARLIDDVSHLRTAVATWVRTQGRASYDGLSVGTLVSANLLTSTTVRTPWGDPIVLTPRTSDSYWVVLPNLPLPVRDALVRHFQQHALEMSSDGQQLRLAFQ